MKTLVALMTLVPALADAHPGHGTTEPTSWAHYLTEPLHAGVLASVTVVALLVARARGRVERSERD